ncbi:uncharacterized protein PHALS_13032 [Plasmopara halstedii]|uniref:Uncharacterized protein n=1 Tax=Plasmopara halstedii TaxID=4781 RepID=A0A0P1APN5_PLAHL|nr:uncharacterized protein PHALS_13032 [Plasmopara halstedii]CEG42783.1 hypothetical protein PHALS_13032 [Plasmopara halstedii]|eukprot:XP_024579152.1 hypothetical protein PHALS_13032 [Plasmopara halstedii]
MAFEIINTTSTSIQDLSLAFATSQALSIEEHWASSLVKDALHRASNVQRHTHTEREDLVEELGDMLT